MPLSSIDNLSAIYGQPFDFPYAFGMKVAVVLDPGRCRDRYLLLCSHGHEFAEVAIPSTLTTVSVATALMEATHRLDKVAMERMGWLWHLKRREWFFGLHDGNVKRIDYDWYESRQDPPSADQFDIGWPNAGAIMKFSGDHGGSEKEMDAVLSDPGIGIYPPFLYQRIDEGWRIMRRDYWSISNLIPSEINDGAWTERKVELTVAAQSFCWHVRALLRTLLQGDGNVSQGGHHEMRKILRVRNQLEAKGPIGADAFRMPINVCVDALCMMHHEGVTVFQVEDLLRWDLFLTKMYP